MTRVCPHCSAPLEDGDTVCPSCGQSVVPTPEETPSAEVVAGPVDESGVGLPPADEAPESLAEAPEAVSEPDEASEAALPEGSEADDEPLLDDPALEAEAAPEISDAPETDVEPQFEAEAFPLDEEQPGEAPDAPKLPMRHVVFRCERCQMPLVPGTSACLRCGLPRAEPVPNIPIHASHQTPMLRQGEYHCPECQAVLAPQSSLCTHCGAEFVTAVPPVSWGTPGMGTSGGGGASVWARPAPVSSRPEPWKIAAAVIAVVAFAGVLLLIGSLTAGNNPPPETVVTAPGPVNTTGNVAPPAQLVPPIVMAPGTSGAAGQIHATPVGTWVKGRNSLRLDEIGGAWVDAPDVTGSQSKVNMNWTLVNTDNGQVVRVQGPGYTWDFAWNFGPDGAESLTQSQWGELKKLPEGGKPGAKPAAKPAVQPAGSP